MVEIFYTNIIFDHYQVALITLCGKGIKQSQSPREMDDSESNFKPCKGKPIKLTSDREYKHCNFIIVIVVAGI
jgi:hypothetical protein